MPTLQATSTELTHAHIQLPPESIVFGRTEHMLALRNRIEKVVALDMPVLVEGENGTGKDVIAQMLHQRSPWTSGVFVKIRCSCIPDSLDDLFASEAAASESQAAAGRPQSSCYGTLFLDEISETTAALQAKLLRLLQEGPLCSINLKRCKLNLRLICATSCGLEEAAARGNFRRDLLYRINVLTLRVAPLRDRIADIPDLANYFLELFNSVYGCQAKCLSRNMLQSLLSYSWPGNIRELENFMKRYVLFGWETVCNERVDGKNKKLEPEAPEPNTVSLKEITRKAVRELEREEILKVLHANHWNRKRAASALNISYRALLYKLKDAGIPSAPPASNRTAKRLADRPAV